MNADTDTRYVYDRNRPFRAPAKSYHPGWSTSAPGRDTEGPERDDGAGRVCGPCDDPDGIPEVYEVPGRISFRMKPIRAFAIARRYDTQPADCDGGVS